MIIIMVISGTKSFLPPKVFFFYLKFSSIVSLFGIKHSVQSLSRVRLFCDPMNHSTPGLPVHHQLPESTQTHVH